MIYSSFLFSIKEIPHQMSLQTYISIGIPVTALIACVLVIIISCKCVKNDDAEKAEQGNTASEI